MFISSSCRSPRIASLARGVGLGWVCLAVLTGTIRPAGGAAPSMVRIAGQVVDAESKAPIRKFHVQMLRAVDLESHSHATTYLGPGRVPLEDDIGWMPVPEKENTGEWFVDRNDPAVDPATGLPIVREPTEADHDREMIEHRLLAMGPPFLNGRFALESLVSPRERIVPVYIRITAIDYEPQVFGPIRRSAQKAPLTCPLRRASTVSVFVVDPEGRPVPKANVLVTREGQLTIDGRNGTPEFSSELLESGWKTLIADAQGKIRLSGELVLHDSIWICDSNGFGRAKLEDVRFRPKLVREPWGELLGRWTVNGKPLSGQRLSVVADLTGQFGNPGMTWLRTAALGETDAQGRFRIRTLVPGAAVLHRGVPCGAGTAYAGYRKIVVKPGVLTEVQIDEQGGEIFGAIEAPTPAPDGFALGFGFFRVSPVGSMLEEHPWSLRGETRSATRNGEYERVFPITFDADGVFHAEGIPPGRYRALFDFLDSRPPKTPKRAKRSGVAISPIEAIASAPADFVIEDGATAPLNLGVLRVRANIDTIEIGSLAPPLKFKDESGVTRSLAGFAPRLVLLVLGDQGHPLLLRGEFVRYTMPPFREQIALIHIRPSTDPDPEFSPAGDRAGLGLGEGWVVGRLPSDEIEKWIRSVAGSGQRLRCLIDGEGRIHTLNPNTFDVDRCLKPGRP